jgi:acetolactate synthase-1/2/3 large subunit
MFFDRRKSFTRMLNPSYQKIASGYNIPYRLVVDRAELDAAVSEMLATDGPFLLECAVREEDNVLPMTPPGKSVDEMLLEM